MAGYHLAQLNIAVLKAPLDSLQLADFVSNLDCINALAEQAPGFIWRLQTDDGDATALRPLGEQTIVNMSVWADAQVLAYYVYRSAHVAIMWRRREWFERLADAHIVLWWVTGGHRPDVAEALARLRQLREQGPSAQAFTFRQLFPAPDQGAPAGLPLGGECPS
jgi:hypothetical protein